MRYITSLTHSTRIVILMAIFSLFGMRKVYGQTTFTSNVTNGDYNVAGSWIETGTNDLDNIPDANDIVIILNGHNISLTANESASTLSINNGGLDL